MTQILLLASITTTYKIMISSTQNTVDMVKLKILLVFSFSVQIHQIPMAKLCFPLHSVEKNKNIKNLSTQESYLSTEPEPCFSCHNISGQPHSVANVETNGTTVKLNLSNSEASFFDTPHNHGIYTCECKFSIKTLHTLYHKVMVSLGCFI